MIKPVLFSPEEQSIINDKRESEGFCKESWSDKDLAGIKKKIKQHYLVEQNNCCYFCRREHTGKHGNEWTTEHLLSRSDYPEFMFEPFNLCVICWKCNQSKQDKKIIKGDFGKYPDSSELFQIVHPHFDIYERYFPYYEPEVLYFPWGDKGAFTYLLYNLGRFSRDNKFEEFSKYDGRIGIKANQYAATLNTPGVSEEDICAELKEIKEDLLGVLLKNHICESINSTG